MDQKNIPVISVLMAVYNGEAFLREAIESVLDQTFRNFELLIINDGSSDKTEDIILSYKDPRIVYIKNQQNLKLVGTLNKGISLAKGDYIARIDADDVMYPHRLQKQFDFFAEHPEVGVIGSDLDVIDEAGNRIHQWKYPNTDSALKQVLIKKNPFAHPAVTFRKSLVQEMGMPYNTKYPSCEDYDLWIRLHKKTAFYSFNEALIKYRLHSGQITNKKIKKVQRDTFRLIVNSVSRGKLPAKALVYLYKPLFYIISPKPLINWKAKFENRT